MRSESVDSALFLLVYHPVSPLASSMKETNRISYQNLPVQGNRESKSLSVPGFL